MFELLELILASPLGAALLTAMQDTIYAAYVVSDCDECGFNDLGKLLFGGLILAAVVGIAISILLRRVWDGPSNSSEFVSIRAQATEQTETSTGEAKHRSS
jgi:uncharacterized protein HemY